MRTRDVDKLPIGVYLVHWRDDTASLAAVGMTQQGSRWLAPVNWTRPSTDRRVWRLVRRLSKAAVPPAPCIGHDPVCPCQDGDPCHYRDTTTTKAMSIPVRAAPAPTAVCAKCGYIATETACLMCDARLSVKEL